MRFVRNPSCHIKTPTWNFYKEIYKQRWYQNGLLITFLEESHEEYRKRLCKQTLLWLVIMRKSLRNPEEQADHKRRDVEQSAPTHAHHTHCTSRQLGTTADRRCDIPRDWLWEVCHMARVFWGTCCEGFCSKEGPHYQMEQSARNHLERDQVQRVPEKSSSSCRQTSNNKPYSRVRKSLWDSFPGLYCVDLAKAYVMQESVSSRILMRRKGMICDRPMDVCTRNLWKKAERGKNAGTNSGTRPPQASYFEKMHKMCQKYGGACTTW